MKLAMNILSSEDSHNFTYHSWISPIIATVVQTGSGMGGSCRTIFLRPKLCFFLPDLFCVYTTKMKTFV